MRMANKRKAAAKTETTSKKKPQVNGQSSDAVAQSAPVAVLPAAVEEEAFPRGRIASSGKRTAESVVMQHAQQDDLFADPSMEPKPKKQHAKPKKVATPKSKSKNAASDAKDDEFSEYSGKGGVELLHFKVWCLCDLSL